MQESLRVLLVMCQTNAWGHTRSITALKQPIYIPSGKIWFIRLDQWMLHPAHFYASWPTWNEAQEGQMEGQIKTHPLLQQENVGSVSFPLKMFHEVWDTSNEDVVDSHVSQKLEIFEHTSLNLLSIASIYVLSSFDPKSGWCKWWEPGFPTENFPSAQLFNTLTTEHTLGSVCQTAAGLY